MQVRRFWSVPHVERHRSELALLIALAALPTLRTMGERRIAQAEQRKAA